MPVLFEMAPTEASPRARSYEMTTTKEFSQSKKKILELLKE